MRTHVFPPSYIFKVVCVLSPRLQVLGNRNDHSAKRELVGQQEVKFLEHQLWRKSSIRCVKNPQNIQSTG